MVWHFPLTFDPQEVFFHIFSVSLVPKDGGLEVPLSFTQSFAPLYPCHDYYLQVFIRDKHWIFTLRKESLLLPRLTGHFHQRLGIQESFEQSFIIIAFCHYSHRTGLLFTSRHDTHQKRPQLSIYLNHNNCYRGQLSGDFHIRLVGECQPCSHLGLGGCLDRNRKSRAPRCRE